MRIALLCAVLTCALAAPVSATVPPVSHPGRILVTTVDRAPVRLLAGAARVTHLARAGIDVLSVPDVAAALAAYRDLADVASVEADRKARIASAPNDPYYSAQWTLHPSNGPGSPSPFTLNWEPVHPQLQGDGVVVAVLDTGYEKGGSDQPVALDTSRARNFVNPAADTSDDNGHGTFIANMIAEATDNATGAAGIAPHAVVVPVKVLAADGTGDLGIVAQGIDYAVSIGAKVINLSLAGDQSAALCRAVAVASQTAVVVAASGNDAATAVTRPIDFPAACPGALAIGSVAADGSRPNYANTGCPMAAVAPGGDDLRSAQADWILQQGYDATVGDPSFGTFQYFEEKGTSMSSAQAAGEAALLLGAGAGVTQTRRLMLATARPVSSSGFTPEFGAGALDIAAAAAALAARPSARPMMRGYRVVTSTGHVSAIGDACQSGGYQGQLSGPLARPVVGAAATPSGNGYWMVASDGGIFSFGDAAFYGSTGNLTLNKPIVGMAPTSAPTGPGGRGYWMVASDGGIFSFGDAAFYGSTGNLTLNKPIVGMAPTPSGRGYWMVASDGGIFSFGDAAFYGSTGNITLNKPIVGMAPTPSGRGYWMVASDGGIFSFGDAAFYGSIGSTAGRTVAGMTASTDGRGYLLVGSDGSVFPFGDAPFFGSALGAASPTVAITPAPWPGL